MTENKLNNILENWLIKLADKYDQREIKNMFNWSLEDILGLTRMEWMLLNELDQNQSAKLSIVLSELVTGRPYQYSVGVCEFDGLRLKIDERALIPRPETEELVIWISDTFNTAGDVTIIDWCTGSGCIALALKNRFSKDTRVIGIDYYEKALELARLNSEHVHLNVEWLQSDALGIDRPIISCDCIVSNPPYIPTSEGQSMHTHVIDFEPSTALFVPDNDPLLFYRNLVDYAVDNLKQRGWLFFELHQEFAQQTMDLVVRNGNFDSVEIRKDMQGKSRMLRAQRT